MKFCYLIEVAGPTFLRGTEGDWPLWTLNPWDAAKFHTKQEAEAQIEFWRKKRSGSQLLLGAKAVEHGFEIKAE